MKLSRYCTFFTLLAVGSFAVACSDSFEDAPAQTGGTGGTGGDGVDGGAGSGGTAGSGGGSAGAGAAGVGGEGGSGGTQAGGAGGDDAGPGGSGGSAGEDAGPGGASGAAGSDAGPGGAAGAAGQDAGPCPAGYADCDGDDGNGCETPLGTLDDCGSCGDVCGSADNATVACEGYVCTYTCDASFDDCDGDDGNGCETAIDTVGDCGSCGNVCDVPDHASAVCESGVCDFVCTGTYEDCDGSAGNGCESDITADPINCGACGSPCPAGGHGTPTCTSSTCGIDCTGTWDNCDGQLGNGCEIDLATDASNCGSCGNACPVPANATPTCSGSQCGYTCVAGWADCDGSAANGCEVNLNTDVSNCGDCGTVCGTAHGTASCTAGSCSIQCHTGYGDCDGQNPNGCEVNLTNSADNCGSCGHDCLDGGCASSYCTAWTVGGTLNYPRRIAVNATHVYYTENLGVFRIPVGGGIYQMVVASDIASDIDLDLSHVYWTTGKGAGNNGVYRAPLAGGTASTIVEGLDRAYSVAVDDFAIYWSHDDGVSKKLKGGVWPTDLVTGYEVDDITLDDANVYFIQNDVAGAVSWIPKAGGSVTDLMTNQNRPTSVAVDDDTVYFPRFGTGDVMVIGKNGYGADTLASGFDSPARVAVDTESLFFTDSNGGLVVQVEKAGSSSPITRHSGGTPYDIVVTGGIIYFADISNNRIYAMVK